ncbi:MAG: RAMP superfamily CRISPR-associated protein, partial [Ktedonobacteraceae bacterium]
MRDFSLNLETISPLAIRADHAPTRAESVDYISGTALAGSLATLYRFYYQQDDAQFEQLFLSGQVHFPDLYPATFGSENMQKALNAPVYALPKTAQSCKRFSGFMPLPDEDVARDERHGVRDTLLDWAAFELANSAQRDGQPIDVNTLLKPLREHKSCPYPGCGKPMDHFAGYYRRSEDGRLATSEAEKRLQTRTGINRDTGTVQEGILYNRSVFQEHTRFWGQLKVSEDLIPPLKAFIEEVGLSGLLRVGTGRTRGLGKVHLSIEPVPAEQHNIETFKQNLETFNNTLKEVALKWFPQSSYDLALKPFYFAVTLHSPGIIRDPLLRYMGTLAARTLLPDAPEDTITPIYQAASTKRVTGWNEL